MLSATVAVIAFGRVAGLGTIGWAGLGLLVGAKFVSVIAMGAGQGWRGSAPAAERSALLEAITLGALLAFVVGLALGGRLALPRVLILIDWMATLGVLAVARRRSAHPKTPEQAIEPDVQAAFRDRVVLVTVSSGRGFPALIRQLRALQPARLLILDRPRLGGGIAQTFAEARPDVVLHAHEPSVGGDAARAVGTRRLIGESLRAGVGAFVLITRRPRSAEPTLSERIVRALAGLTRSRLIRVRIDPGLGDDEAARRTLRIAAKGRDGLMIQLGYGGGVCDEPTPRSRDAGDLWEQMDKIEDQ